MRSTISARYPCLSYAARILPTSNVMLASSNAPTMARVTTWDLLSAEEGAPDFVDVRRGPPLPLPSAARPGWYVPNATSLTAAWGAEAADRQASAARVWAAREQATRAIHRQIEAVVSSAPRASAPLLPLAAAPVASAIHPEQSTDTAYAEV